MEGSLPLFYSGGGMEGMAGFLLPYQQRQQQTGWLYFPAPRPMLLARPSYSLAIPPLSMDQSLTNLGLQSNQPRAALPQQHTPLLLPSQSMTSFLLAELAKTRERIMELEACVTRAEEEGEMWQRMAREHEATVASLRQTVEQLREPSIGSSPDAGDAASCAGHLLAAAEEPREGTGMGLCKAGGSPNSRVPLLSGGYLCPCELSEAFVDSCPLHNP